MSAGWAVVAFLVALALASMSLRVLIGLPAAQRPGRVVLIAGTIGLALGVFGTLWGWELWAVWALVGLALVEVGPVVLSVARGAGSAAKAWLERKGGAP